MKKKYDLYEISVIGVIGFAMLTLYAALMISTQSLIFRIIASFIFIFIIIKVFDYLKEVFENERNIGNRETVHSEVESRDRISRPRNKDKVRESRRSKKRKEGSSKKDIKHIRKTKKGKASKTRQTKKGKR